MRLHVHYLNNDKYFTEYLPDYEQFIANLRPVLEKRQA